MQSFLLSLLAIVVNCGFPLFLCDHIEASQKHKSSRTRALLVGPIGLGDLFSQMDDAELFKNMISCGGGPTENELVKALNGCQVLFIDSRDSNGRLSKSRPEVVFKGVLSFSFRVNEKAFDVQIRQIKIEALNNDYDDSSRQAVLGISLETSPYTVATKNNVQATSTSFNYTSPPVYWNRTGRLTIVNRKVE